MVVFCAVLYFEWLFKILAVEIKTVGWLFQWLFFQAFLWPFFAHINDLF